MHVPSLLEELKMLQAAGIDYQGRILISDRAHIVFDFHQMVIPPFHLPSRLRFTCSSQQFQIDGLNESKLSKEGAKLGTTLKGIGPSYGSKIARTGVWALRMAFHISAANILHRSNVRTQNRRFEGHAIF